MGEEIEHKGDGSAGSVGSELPPWESDIITGLASLDEPQNGSYNDLLDFSSGTSSATGEPAGIFVRFAPIFLFIAFPAAIFGIPAMLGHPILNGDNLIQNYPLRVLSGKALAQGHLPLWDPFEWSGSPLLGGFNAGALYPFTYLFAFLPPMGAWVIGQIATYAISCIGVYCLCRTLRIGQNSSLLAAFVWGFMGTMAAQLVHFGLVAGVSWIPWALIALFKIAEGVGKMPSGQDAPRFLVLLRAQLGWVLLAAFSVSMVVLAGEPRAISDAALVLGISTAWLARRSLPNGLRLKFTYLSLTAGAWAMALGAVQLLPGLVFLAGSQRSNASYALFSSGSLPVSWSILMLIPDFLGGTGSIGQPQFFGNYQFTEVTGYVGLLPLAAALALPVGAFARRKEVPHPENSENTPMPYPKYGLWLLITVVGLVLSWGGSTPFGHLLAGLPLYGGQRLQSRNLTLVDLGLIVMFAYWLDRAISYDPRDDDAHENAIIGHLLGRHASPSQMERTAALVPAAAAIVFALGALVFGSGLVSHFSVSSEAVSQAGSMSISLVIGIVVAIAVGAAILFFDRVAPWRRGGLFGAVVVLEVLFFACTSLVNLSSGAATRADSMVSSSLGSTSSARMAASAQSLSNPGLAPNSSHRFAVYDPQLLNKGGLSQVGEPDLNALRAQPSVQGYGSLAPGDYAASTATHGQDVLDPSILSSPQFLQLNDQYLYTMPQYLMSQTVGPVSSGPPASRLIAAAQARTWLFDRQIDVASISVDTSPASGSANGNPVSVRVGILEAAGQVYWPPSWDSAGSGLVMLALNQPIEGIGLEIQNGSQTASQSISNLVVTSPGEQSESMNGPLSGYLQSPQWRFAGVWAGYDVFENTQTQGWVWGSGDLTSEIISGTVANPVVVKVSSDHGGTLYRSVGFANGWIATLQPDGGGASRTQSVGRYGLVQQVQIPPGVWKVTFSYSPESATVGLALSIISVITLIAAFAYWRRNSKSPVLRT